jgi:hypothetical protein
VEIDWDSAAVINDADSASGSHCHLDLGAVAGQGFINRVIYDLIDEVMEASLACGADIHAGALTNGI